MVVQKAFNNLKKEGTKEDKVAVASGIAISLVVVLLAAWAIFFFRGIKNGSTQLQLGGAQDQFNFDSVQEAQKQLQEEFGSPMRDLQNLRGDSQTGGSGQMQTQQMEVQGETTDHFNTPSQ